MINSDMLPANPWAILPSAYEKLLATCAEAATLEAAWPASTSKTLPTAPAAMAILPIRGVILPYTCAWATLLGATCLDQLIEDFCRARDNSDVQAIVLAIDSPGGMITGVHALSELVFAARKVKPVLAMVSGLATSAAYWIAAAASQVWVDPTASVGSIGVIATYPDTRERDQKMGIQRREIISSQSPYKRVDAATDTGRSQLQAHVDQLAEVFIAAVAHYRNVSKEKVLADFGQGGLVVGQAAVIQGLADKVHTFPSLFTHTFHFTGDHAMTNQATKTDLEKYLETDAYKAHKAEIQAMLAEEKADMQALYDQGFTAGREAGIAAERLRIQAIEAQSLPGLEDLIQTLKFKEACSASDAALHILTAEKARQSALQVALVADTPPPLPPMLTEESLERPLSLAEKCQREWESSAALQAEFPEADVYFAYREAETQGLIKTPLK